VFNATKEELVTVDKVGEKISERILGVIEKEYNVDA